MRNNDKKSEKIYGEMILSRLSDFENAVLSQLRNLTNTMANILIALRDINHSLADLISTQATARETRYQDEIADHLEEIERLNKQIAEKREAINISTKSTSDIEKISIEKAQETFINMQEQTQREQQKEQKTRWQKMKDAALTALLVSFTLAIAWAVFWAVVANIKK